MRRDHPRFFGRPNVHHYFPLTKCLLIKLKYPTEILANGVPTEKKTKTDSFKWSCNELEPTFSLYYRGHLDVHRSSVEDPRASIKEKQDKHAKNVAGALKKRRTGKGNVKNSSTSPENISEVVFFYI